MLKYSNTLESKLSVLKNFKITVFLYNLEMFVLNNQK